MVAWWQLFHDSWEGVMSEGRTVQIDLHAGLIAFFRSELTRIGYVEVSEHNDRELPRIYFDVCRRLVTPEPRRIHKAKGFSRPPQFRNALAAIERKIENGEDILPHLSRKLRALTYNDALLNDWGIQHLHLGARIESDGFVERTGPLLYCKFEQADAYLIDVLPHGNWTTQTLLTTVHENWPGILRRFRLHGVRGTQISDREIKELRRKNWNYCLEMADGTTYAPPGGGVVGTGSNLSSVFAADQYFDLIRAEQVGIGENIDEIASAASHQGVELPEPAIFELHLLDGKFHAVERDSRVAICLKSISGEG